MRRVPVALLPAVIGYKLLSHLVFAARHGLLRPCLEGIGAFVAAAGEAWRSRRPVRLASLVRFHTLARSPSLFAGPVLPAIIDE